MTAAVKLSRKLVERLARFFTDRRDMIGEPESSRIAEQLRAALAPKPKSSAVRKTEKKRRARTAETKDVRAAVVERSGGRCECGCGISTPGMQLDHFWGRKRSESVESCWLLTPYHHQLKTENRPNAAAWLERFRAHCIRHGYWEEAKKVGRRLAYVKTKAAFKVRAEVANVG